MNSASQTTARVVQPEMQLEEVSSQYAGFTARIKTWFSSVFNHHIPYGYEDESGFHYGAPASDRNNQI